MNACARQARACRRAAAAAGLAAAAFSPAVASAQECGALSTHYGPFDYRVDVRKLPVVENRHFTPRIEALVAGETAKTPGPDLEYTLRAFPNHSRALVAITRWARMNKTLKPRDLSFSVDCFFERALQFRSNDFVVRMLYAQWLGQTQRKPQALTQLNLVKPEGNPLTRHNLGLVYAELGEHELALRTAHELMAEGYPISTLEATLTKAGRWQPPPAPAATPAPAPAPAASAASAAEAAASD